LLTKKLYFFSPFFPFFGGFGCFFNFLGSRGQTSDSKNTLSGKKGERKAEKEKEKREREREKKKYWYIQISHNTLPFNYFAFFILVYSPYMTCTLLLEKV